MIPRSLLGTILTAKPEARVRAHAWACFKGSGAAPVLFESYNVASLTSNGVGDYTVTFTRAFPVASQYVFGGLSQQSTGTAHDTLQLKQNDLLTAGSVRFTIRDRGDTAQDPEWVSIVAAGWSV